MYGHTDYGITTLLFSVPVTALHIWTRRDKWQPVRYNPGSLVINLGEALEIISGGHFKATRHKVGCVADIAKSDPPMTCIQVTDTPKDQQHLERCESN
jgi:isopenicillin N synthase-like dioxygenase